MNKNVIKSTETEIGKNKFHQHKSPMSIYDVDFNKILVLQSLFR